jgi:hypothetical protein
VVVVVYFFVLAGLFTFGRLVEPVKLAHKWIRGSEAEAHWLVVVFAGPLVIGRGIRKLPLWTKMVFVGVFAWGTAVPTGFFHIEGKVAAIWTFGFLADGKWVADFLSPLMSFAYLYLMLQAFMIALSVCDYELNLSFIVDRIVLVACVVCEEVVWILTGAILANRGMWLASFTFIIFPVFFIRTVAVIYRAKFSFKNGRVPLDADPPLILECSSSTEKSTIRKVSYPEAQPPEITRDDGHASASHHEL